MQKIVLYIFIIAVIFSSVILGIGSRVGPEIDAKLEFVLPESYEYIYDLYTNVLMYIDRKPDIKNIEVFETVPRQVLSWKENYERNYWKEYEVTTYSRPSYFDYSFYDSRYGTKSEITVTFNESGTVTQIIMTEKTKINNLFMRGLTFLMGDNFNLKREAKWLRVAILQDQIKRK